MSLLHLSKLLWSGLYWVVIILSPWLRSAFCLLLGSQLHHSKLHRAAHLSTSSWWFKGLLHYKPIWLNNIMVSQPFCGSGSYPFSLQGNAAFEASQFKKFVWLHTGFHEENAMDTRVDLVWYWKFCHWTGWVTSNTNWISLLTETDRSRILQVGREHYHLWFCCEGE